MWDQRYNTEEYLYGKEPNDFLVSAAENIPHGRVLCLGEGEGRNAVFLASRGYNVTALDLSENGLKKVQKLASEKGVLVEILLADLKTYPGEKEAWDGIISIFCHLPKALRKEVHQNIISWLKPGGILIMELYSLRQLENNTGGPSSKEMLLTLKELEEDFKELEFIIKKETDRDIHEGSLHNGKSAVIQIIARKRE